MTYCLPDASDPTRLSHWLCWNVILGAYAVKDIKRPLAFPFHLRWWIDTVVPRHFQAHPLDTKASYYTRFQLGTCTTLSFLGSSVSGNGQMAFSEKSCLAAVQCCSVTQNSFRIAFFWYVKSVTVHRRLLMAIHCRDSFRAKSTILFFSRISLSRTVLLNRI